MSVTAQPRLLSTGSITSDSVKNLQDDDLGHIKDLMIDTVTGRVAYAVLSFGGILGFGDKLFAVPWSSLTLDADRKCFLLDANKENLKQAPGFDKNHWPQIDELDWQRDVHSFYGLEPYWEDPRYYQG